MTNGPITLYTIAYYPLQSLSGIDYRNNSDLQNTESTTHISTTVKSLRKATQYTFTITAYTVVGPGPPSTDQCQVYTLEDSECYCNVNKQ